ncbi:MAG: ABC transporter ATP-binding protein [Actinomycetaceae bacterium]|nr:ABC transporter ATP-binding protein [Actinomycetaceae bacterium]
MHVKSWDLYPQDTGLYEDITGPENLRVFGEIYGLKRDEIEQHTDNILDVVTLSRDTKKLVSNYSGGMKRRFSLAVALLNHPRVLTLDEPTVGLAPLSRFALWQHFHELADARSALLITTHSMSEAERCHRVAMVRDGYLIAFDTPRAIVA